MAAHAVGRLPTLASAAVALLLGHTAHSTGWPLPEGGSARIAEALASDITTHGGTFRTGHRIRDLAELGRFSLVGTIHLGGTHDAIVRQENAVAAGGRGTVPFTLVVDPAVTDPRVPPAGSDPYGPTPMSLTETHGTRPA